jgi:hypothetical protein
VYPLYPTPKLALVARRGQLPPSIEATWKRRTHRTRCTRLDLAKMERRRLFLPTSRWPRSRKNLGQPCKDAVGRCGRWCNVITIRGRSTFLRHACLDRLLEGKAVPARNRLWVPGPGLLGSSTEAGPVRLVSSEPSSTHPRSGGGRLRARRTARHYNWSQDPLETAGFRLQVPVASEATHPGCPHSHSMEG